MLGRSASAIVISMLTGLAPPAISVARADPTPDIPRRGTVTAPILDIIVGTQDVAGTITVQEAQGGLAIRLDATVLFSRDSSRLEPAAKQVVRRASRELRDKGGGRVLVTGYTDDLGSAQHGLALSRHRAAAVAHLIRASLPPGYDISSRGRGEADPAVPNTSEANRARNRRVVIELAQE